MYAIKTHVGTLLWKNFLIKALVNCPECFAKERKAVFERQAESESQEGIQKLIEEIEIPMKFDPVTKHFICKKCGLYATREGVNDIRDRLNRREATREDKQYDYLEWWQKSKKDKI
jgi:hypothetical protein